MGEIDFDELGEAAIDAIVSGGLVRAICADGASHGVVLRWSGNAREQLGERLRRELFSMEPKAGEAR